MLGEGARQVELDLLGGGVEGGALLLARRRATHQLLEGTAGARIASHRRGGREVEPQPRAQDGRHPRRRRRDGLRRLQQGGRSPGADARPESQLPLLDEAIMLLKDGIVLGAYVQREAVRVARPATPRTAAAAWGFSTAAAVAAAAVIGNGAILRLLLVLFFLLDDGVGDQNLRLSEVVAVSARSARPNSASPC